jgi:hypothetical protein
MPHYSATWGSMVCSAAELAAALTVLATIWSYWRVLYPNSGSFEGRARWLTVVSSDGLEEAVDDDPYGIQWQAWRRPVSHGAGVVVTVPGVVLRARGRPHRTNSGGDGVPPA